MNLHAVAFEQHVKRLPKSRIVIDNVNDGLSHFRHPYKFAADRRYCLFLVIG